MALSIVQRREGIRQHRSGRAEGCKTIADRAGSCFDLCGSHRKLVLFTTCMPLDLGGVRSIPISCSRWSHSGFDFFWSIRREVTTAHDRMLERNRRAEILGTAVQTSPSHLLMSKSIIGYGFNGLLLFGSWGICGLTNSCGPSVSTN